MIKNVEDCIEYLASFRNIEFNLDRSDYSLIHSLARQVSKNTALTDRQYELAKRKVITYKDQFEKNNLLDIEIVIENLRLPLRQIDRSKYIKIVNTSDVYDNNNVYESYQSDWKWIKVRFPFSKKLIIALENCKPRDLSTYYHKSGTHTHFFKFNEKNVFNIVKIFGDKSFDIDSEILTYYEMLLEMNNNKDKYIPGVYNLKLKNLHQKAIDFMISSIGLPNINNLALYKERSEKLGLRYFDQDDLDSSVENFTLLSKKFINRKKDQVFVDSKKYTFNQLTETILELYRLPLLVVLPSQNELECLHLVHQAFANIIHQDSSSVTFRLDNTAEGKEFNQYIKDKNINCTVDNSTKIVYTDTYKITKPLLKSSWRPSAVLLLSSEKVHNRISSYIDNVDLIIHYDNEPSRWYSRNIEEL